MKSIAVVLLAVAVVSAHPTKNEEPLLSDIQEKLLKHHDALKSAMSGLKTTFLGAQAIDEHMQTALAQLPANVCPNTLIALHKLHAESLTDHGSCIVSLFNDIVWLSLGEPFRIAYVLLSSVLSPLAEAALCILHPTRFGSCLTYSARDLVSGLVYDLEYPFQIVLDYIHLVGALIADVGSCFEFERFHSQVSYIVNNATVCN